MVTKAQLRKLFPGAKATLVDAVANNWGIAEAAGIKTPRRIRQFLANIGVETGGLKSVEESLNYSATALISKFGRHRISEADAKKYGRSGNRKANQVMIANTIYGGAWGKKNLGNTEPNDGWDMRGGGMMQTTGRKNYRDVGFERNPSALREPNTAFKTAVAEWVKRGCNELADADRTEDLRRKINGGTNGLEELKTLLTKAKAIWPDSAAVVTDKKPVEIVEDVYDGKPHDIVLSVQTRLDELGYYEVGKLDGRYGSRTAGAITTFQGDNGLKLDPKIDQALLAALMAASPRKVDPERANATVADLRKEGTVEIKQTDQTKYAGYGLAAMGAFTGGQEALDKVKGTSDTVRSIWDTLEPIQSLILDNIWLILLGGGAFFVWKSGLLQRIRVTKHQKAEDVSH